MLTTKTVSFELPAPGVKIAVNVIDQTKDHPSYPIATKNYCIPGQHSCHQGRASGVTDKVSVSKLIASAATNASLR